MKLKVINAFCDKIDHVTVYEPGTILEVNDVERAQDLITRELCKEFKGKTAPTFVLGETNSPDSLTESEGESENNSENQSENNSENQSENNSENESEEESENGSSETSPNSDNDE